jgi:signal peptidase I
MEERRFEDSVPQLDTQEKNPDTDYKAILYDWVKTILLAIILALFVRTTIVGAYFVPTGSMKPTIGIGDRLLGVKFLYWLAEPEHGDIVVFEPPPSAHSDVPRYVKRVVAVEGDIVEVNHGTLYVNGEPVDEPYASPPMYRMQPTQVPEGSLFVLGDNRNNSADGHVWGFLPKQNVEAKIVFRFWPLTRVGTLNNAR